MRQFRSAYRPIEPSRTKDRLLYCVKKEWVAERDITRTHGGIFKQRNGFVISVGVRIRTKDMEFDEGLNKKLKRFCDASITYANYSGENFYDILVYMLLDEKAPLSTRINKAVEMVNAAAALVYTAKEAGQFEGADVGRPPMLELTMPFGREPRIENLIR